MTGPFTLVARRSRLLDVAECAPTYAICVRLSIIKWLINVYNARIGFAAKFRCQFAADLVWLPEGRAEIRCRTTLSNHHQIADIHRVFDVEWKIFGRQNGFFPC
jgi:hypothetical protein